MQNAETERKDEEGAPPSVSLMDARLKLGDLAYRASVDGERIVLTSHGRPVAALVGLRDLAKLEAAAA